MELQFSNFRVNDDYVLADVFEDNNYMGVFGGEICHVTYTADLEYPLYKDFRKKALEYLNQKPQLIQH